MRVRSSAGSAHDESLPLSGGERILGTHGSLVRNLGVGVGGGGQGGRRDRGLRRHELRDRLWHLLRGDRHRLLLRQHLLGRGGDGHRLLRRDGLRLRHRLGHRLCHGQLGQRVDVRHSDVWGGELQQVERDGMRTRRRFSSVPKLVLEVRSGTGSGATAESWCLGRTCTFRELSSPCSWRPQTR